MHTASVAWEVDLHDDFAVEYRELPPEAQDELLACVELLEQFGPQLGRPRADTLNDSQFANMKELRFDAADAADGWLLRSIQSAGRFCWWRATNPAGARGGSTGS